MKRQYTDSCALDWESESSLKEEWEVCRPKLSSLIQFTSNKADVLEFWVPSYFSSGSECLG